MSPSKREVIHIPKASKFNRDFAIVLSLGLILLVVSVLIISNLIEQENKHVDSIGKVKIVSPPGSGNEERESDAVRNLKKQVESNLNAEEMQLQYSDVNDEAMKYIGRLKRLKRLNLAYSNVSDEGLKQLTTLPLEELNLLETSIGDGGMKYVGQIRSLHYLNMLSTHVSDKGLAQLNALDSLGDIDLESTNVSDKGIPELLHNKSLWKVDLSNTDVTNGCLEALSKMESLDALVVGNTSITAQGLARHMHRKITRLSLYNCSLTDSDVTYIVNNFPQMVKLNVSMNSITDLGVLELTKLKALIELNIYRCPVSNAAIVKFQKKLPACKVINNQK